MGRKARGNVVIAFGGTAITGYATQAGVSAQAGTLDTTNLGSSRVESVSDIPEWSVSSQGHFHRTVDALIARKALAPGTAQDASVDFVGTTETVSYDWTADAEVESYQITSQVGGMVTWSATFMLSGQPTRSAA